jgi:HEAT repeat protein
MPLVRKTSATPPPPPPTSAGLHAKIPSERWEAARAMTSAGDVAALGAALATERDASVREAILTSLCQIATPESAAAIIPGVRSDDASARRAALDALVSMPQAAAPHLPALLSDADADVRLLSCEIVRGLPSEQATQLLIIVLRTDAVANVCIAAADVLAEIGNHRALEALDAAEARFPREPFLKFAIEAARDRIAGASHRD